MTDPANSNIAPKTADVRYMMECLDGVARGLGLDQETTRQIVEKVLVANGYPTSDFDH
jgi:cation transport ATPase